MCSGADVVAVLNLESSVKNAFPEETVRPLVWVANQLAVIWQNSLWKQYKRMLEGLLAAADRDPKKVVSRIAEIAARELGFAKCDVWRYNPEADHFDIAAANYCDFEETLEPRLDGWSYYIARRAIPVFISEMESSSRFTAAAWTGRTWSEIREADVPTTVNAASLARGVVAELGVPLLVEGTCVGVLWLKYSEAADPPEANMLRAIEVFARGASPMLQAA
jgi:GAF domain-containing protein